jgi:enoyl-CoA hydratase/carnithine racemase
MKDDLILCDVRGPIATITLNNPPMNLVSLAMMPALDQVLDRIEADGGIRAVVVTGAGDRAFCAGSDIEEFDDLMVPGQVVPRKLQPQYEVFGRLDELPKPTVAALNGYVYGGGLEVAICCDLLVGDEDTLIASPEIKLGVFPGTGGTIRTTRRVGEGRAKELMFLGEPIDAATALEWGLLNRVAPPGESRRVAYELAEMLAERPPRALRYCKQSIDFTFDMSQDEALRRTLPLSDLAFSSPECAEGVSAFRAKRAPAFGPDTGD